MAKIQSLNGTAGKETIYVDVDDEITTIIDKVQNAKGKVIALVLPKRAPVLQSIVNMKLLKRTADNADKNLALITSEAGLLPLAGAVGLHVASTPTSKPGIPSAPPVGPDDELEDIDEPLNIVDDNSGDDDDFDAKAAGSKPVGELASRSNGGSMLAASKTSAGNVDDSIDMTEEDADEPLGESSVAPVSVPKKNNKLRVPNFDNFRKRIALGVLAVVVLVAAWVYAFMIAPRATVTIKTDSSTITTHLNLALDTSVKSLDATNGIVPATAQSQQKTASQQVSATGQQNNGQKASGQITVTNCSGDNVTISAGNSFSAGGHTFIAQNSANIPDSNYTHSGDCKNDGKGTVSVTALKGGADYNLAATAYTISGKPAGITAQGSQMSGGTDDITKIVTQSDIDNATSKITAADSSALKQQLASNLQSKGLLPVPSTFLAGTPTVTSNAQAGATADTVTVTAVTTYTMLGVQKSDLQQLVTHNVDGQIDKSKQVILDDGVANATFTQASSGTPTSASVAMTAKSEAGPHLDTAKLKTQLAGKKSGDVKNFIKQTPGVTDVNVKFSPFWVSVVPKSAGKVTITIDKSGS